MSRPSSAGLLAALACALAPAAARPCGGFFATAVEVAPSQKIVVVHRAGLESYVFRPHFCGAAKDFGVILPIPATLAAAPALDDSALYDDLDLFTAPTAVGVCMSLSGLGCGGAPGAPGGPGGGPDVNVIDRGRVGIFDYVLLQAQTSAAFTDWLDQNGFPHAPAAAAAFDAYVARSWFFVAFKVTADAAPPPAGKKLCGDLGPIRLSFATPRPVIPARIASVNAEAGAIPRWRIFAIAAAQQRLDAASDQYRATPFFSGALRQAELASFPALRATSRDGERLTVLDVDFPSGGATGDIGLEDGPAADYRSTVQVHDERLCAGGCACGRGVSGGGLELLLAGALIAVWRRRALGRFLPRQLPRQVHR